MTYRCKDDGDYDLNDYSDSQDGSFEDNSSEDDSCQENDTDNRCDDSFNDTDKAEDATYCNSDDKGSSGYKKGDSKSNKRRKRVDKKADLAKDFLLLPPNNLETDEAIQTHAAKVEVAKQHVAEREKERTANKRSTQVALAKVMDQNPDLLRIEMSLARIADKLISKDQFIALHILLVKHMPVESNFLQVVVLLVHCSAGTVAGGADGAVHYMSCM
jgi:hypothetical protein